MDEVRRESTENQNGNEYKNVWPANYAAILLLLFLVYTYTVHYYSFINH